MCKSVKRCNNINSDTECTEDLPDSDMDEKGSIDVSCLETCMLHQVMSVANSGCNVYANTLQTFSIRYLLQ